MRLYGKNNQRVLGIDHAITCLLHMWQHTRFIVIFAYVQKPHLSLDMRFAIMWYVRPAKAQTILR